MNRNGNKLETSERSSLNLFHNPVGSRHDRKMASTHRYWLWICEQTVADSDNICACVLPCACVWTDWLIWHLDIKYCILLFFPNWTICAEKVTAIVLLPQIVLGTILSVQMDLTGQHRVQVVGHIPSGSVELYLFFLVIQFDIYIYRLYMLTNIKALWLFSLYLSDLLLTSHSSYFCSHHRK